MPTSTVPLPKPSALTTSIKSSLPHDLAHAPHYYHLAAQILHNLQYQHDWTSLRIHTNTTLPPSNPPSTALLDSPYKSDNLTLLPRPIISGLPPRPLYTHPDDQVAMLKAGVKETDVRVEREWVLPTHLREKWSLRRFGEVFDGTGLDEPMNTESGIGQDDPEVEQKQEVERTEERKEEEGKGWKRKRRAQRVLLATLCDDSTVVYYIVHDGIVKPRQN